MAGGVTVTDTSAWAVMVVDTLVTLFARLGSGIALVTLARSMNWTISPGPTVTAIVTVALVPGSSEPRAAVTTFPVWDGATPCVAEAER